MRRQSFSFSVILHPDSKEGVFIFFIPSFRDIGMGIDMASYRHGPEFFFYLADLVFFSVMCLSFSWNSRSPSSSMNLTFGTGLWLGCYERRTIKRHVFYVLFEHGSITAIGLFV